MTGTPDLDTDLPVKESVFRPCPSVADVPKSVLPIVDLDEERLYATQNLAEQFVTDGGCSSYEGTVKGNLGELAFCEYLPGDRQPDTEIRPDGDGGWDHKYGGMTWDIKTAGRHRTDPPLTVDAVPRLRAQRYALVNRIGKTAFRLVGYAPRAVVKEQRIRTSEHGAYRRVEREKLVPFPQFLSQQA